MHTALELAGGLTLMALPAALGLGIAAAITGIVIGALIVGLALANTGQGRGTIPLSAHIAYDRGIALGLIIAAALLGFAGESGAVAVFLIAGLALLALSTSTRYSAPAEV
jgi:hypothetical protein